MQKPNRKSTLHCVIMFILMTLALSAIIDNINLIQTVKADPSLASIQWTSAVDAAMTELTKDTSFQHTISSIGVPFVVPFCKEIANYPSRNPVPSNITQITICSEPQSATNLWGIVYKIVGKALIANLNKQYSLSLTPRFVSVNTSSGYFPSLRNGINSGECDIVVSDTASSTERAAAVKFASCPYGNTYYAFLRTDLENSTISGIETVDQLNRPDVKISWWYGTLFDKVANSSTPLAQKFPANTMESMFMNAQTQSVHAILFDALDLYSWKSDSPQYCSTSGCYVRVFGEPIPVLIFTQRSNRSSDAMQVGGTMTIAMMVLMMIMSMLLL